MMLNSKWTGTLLGIGALLVRIIAAQFPEGTEQIYSRWIFPVIRQIMDMTLSRLPFPSVYLFLLGVVGILVYQVVQVQRKVGFKQKVRRLARSSINFAGLLVFLFLVLWGYNYQRIPVYQQLSLDPIPLSQEELIKEIEVTHSTMLPLRDSLTSDTLAIEETIPYADLEDIVRKELRMTLSRLGFGAKGHPRTREFLPSGFLRRMGILGIYFPYTGESYIDPTLHVLEKPFTVAHEMAHSFGITNEGEANFISWVTGIQSEQGLLQYCAQLQLLRYQLNDLRKTDPKAYTQTIGTLDHGVINDIRSIVLKSQEIKPISLELTRKSNDLFLKTQGVKAGVKSYAQLPMLAHAWRNR